MERPPLTREQLNALRKPFVNARHPVANYNRGVFDGLARQMHAQGEFDNVKTYDEAARLILDVYGQGAEAQRLRNNANGRRKLEQQEANLALALQLQNEEFNVANINQVARAAENRRNRNRAAQAAREANRARRDIEAQAARNANRARRNRNAREAANAALAMQLQQEERIGVNAAVEMANAIINQPRAPNVRRLPANVAQEVQQIAGNVRVGNNLNGRQRRALEVGMLLLDAQNRVAGAARAARNVAGRAAGRVGVAVGRAGGAAGRAGAEARRAIERAMAAQALIPRGLRAPDMRDLIAGIVRRAQRILGAAPAAIRRPVAQRAAVNAQVVAGDEILARRMAEEANNNRIVYPRNFDPIINAGPGPLKNVDLDRLTKRVVDKIPDNSSDGLYMAKHIWLNATGYDEVKRRCVNYMKLIKYQDGLRKAVKEYVQQYLPRVGPTLRFDGALGQLIARTIQSNRQTVCHTELMNQVLFPAGAPPGKRVDARLRVVDYYINGLDVRGALFRDRFQESSPAQIKKFIEAFDGLIGGVCFEASMTALDNSLHILGGDVDPTWPVAQTNLRTNGNKFNRNSKGVITRAMSAYLQGWEDLGYTNRTTVNTVMRNIGNKKLKINGNVKKVKDVQGMVKPVVEEVFDPIKEIFV